MARLYKILYVDNLHLFIDHIHKLAGLSLSSSHLAGLLAMYSRIRSKEPSARIIWS
ncbi:MAG: hypothetical protein ACR9NN_02120 [Nostochopsis sp.]